MDKVAEFKLTTSRSIAFNILAGVIFLAGFAVFVFQVIRDENGTMISYILSNHNGFITLGTVVMVVILHELFHAVPYIILGGKVKFGIKLLSFYTMDVSRKMYSAPQMIFILLSPLIIITLMLSVGLFIFKAYIYYICMCMLFNIAGSSADISMAIYIITKGINLWIRDEEYGFSIHKSQNASSDYKSISN